MPEELQIKTWDAGKGPQRAHAPGVTANVFKAQSKAVYVYADHLSISEDDVHTGERLE